MFCSIVIPTIGRSTLQRAVSSVLDQEFGAAEYEIVVVNDSGMELKTGYLPQSNRISIITTNRRERSFARNCGAAVARGEYLWFLDDDDWILPGAIESFWQLTNQFPDAVWLYGGIRIVDEKLETIAEINSGLSGNCFAQIMGGSWAPIQSSLIQSRAFFEIGGFNPFICGTEDEDLCRRAAYHGEFANTQQVTACLFRGEAWNTSTNYLRAPDDVKYSRNLILSNPGVFQRLRRSAGSSYWYGRVLRVYLSTIVWNIRRRRFFASLSRVIYGLLFIILSYRHLLSRKYWEGVSADHVPDTLHSVMKAGEIKRSI